MLQELPVTIRNSNLMNVMLAELRLLKPKRNNAHLVSFSFFYFRF